MRGVFGSHRYLRPWARRADEACAWLTKCVWLCAVPNPSSQLSFPSAREDESPCNGYSNAIQTTAGV